MTRTINHNITNATSRLFSSGPLIRALVPAALPLYIDSETPWKCESIDVGIEFLMHKLSLSSGCSTVLFDDSSQSCTWPCLVIRRLCSPILIFMFLSFIFASYPAVICHSFG